jgi:hypothetical protein
MEELIIMIRESENAEVIKTGKIELIFLQYSRNALDFHLPCIATTSGGVPLKRSSVAPPILNNGPSFLVDWHSSKLHCSD